MSLLRYLPRSARAPVSSIGPKKTPLFQGSGLGSVSTVLTLGSNGSSAEESGAVFAVGAGFDARGDAVDGTSQVGLLTFGSCNVTSTSDLRIIVNCSEPTGNSITVPSSRRELRLRAQ